MRRLSCAPELPRSAHRRDCKAAKLKLMRLVSAPTKGGCNYHVAQYRDGQPMPSVMPFMLNLIRNDRDRFDLDQEIRKRQRSDADEGVGRWHSLAIESTDFAEHRA